MRRIAQEKAEADRQALLNSASIAISKNDAELAHAVQGSSGFGLLSVETKRAISNIVMGR
jgi:hypothetical protein